MIFRHSPGSSRISLSYILRCAKTLNARFIKDSPHRIPHKSVPSGISQPWEDRKVKVFSSTLRFDLARKLFVQVDPGYLRTVSTVWCKSQIFPSLIILPGVPSIDSSASNIYDMDCPSYHRSAPGSGKRDAYAWTEGLDCGKWGRSDVSEMGNYFFTSEILE